MNYVYVRRHTVNVLTKGLMTLATIAGVFFLLWIMWTTFRFGVSAMHWSLFTQNTPPPGTDGYGLKNAIVGSLLLMLICLGIGVPVGLMAGTWLAEFGAQSRTANVVRFINDIMLSAPSIEIGLFVYAIMVDPMGHFSGLSGSVALAVLMVLNLILSIATDLHHLRMLNRAIVEAAAPVLPGVAPDQTEHVLAAHLAAARKRLGLLGGSSGPASPLDTLLFLSHALPTGLGVDIDELAVDDTSLKLNGKADSYATIEQLRKALAGTHRLSDVQVSEEGTGEGHKVIFHLTATIKDIGLGPD